MVSALIGVHAFTVLAPQILVLQHMLEAVLPKGTYLLTFIILGANRGPTDCQCHIKNVSMMPYTK